MPPKNKKSDREKLYERREESEHLIGELLVEVLATVETITITRGGIELQPFPFCVTGYLRGTATEISTNGDALVVRVTFEPPEELIQHALWALRQQYNRHQEEELGTVKRKKDISEKYQASLDQRERWRQWKQQQSSEN